MSIFKWYAAMHKFETILWREQDQEKHERGKLGSQTKSSRSNWIKQIFWENCLVIRLKEQVIGSNEQGSIGKEQVFRRGEWGSFETRQRNLKQNRRIN